ncbi:hypothetical protein F4779DRAFT_262428 [Xylariaceae sp. FL0662B]|nr:hypothetical protein F4779DRAFT_262428 [Xylariaceae sp. FL0662B]
MSSSTETTSDLPAINRFITSHDSNGKASYSKDFEERMNFWTVYTGEGQSAGFELGYVTDGFPVQLNGDEDLANFKEAHLSREKSGLVKHGGTVLRYCDIPPGTRSPMHRIVSLDYGILISGELDSILDSGEVRTIRPGDVVIQRGTMHQWHNRSKGWARIVFILLHALRIEIDGYQLGEVQGRMRVPLSH